jgi:hypothetical protein
MSVYRIGIDFGTSQTKVCSTIVGISSEENRQFIFHKFSKTSNYFLPSTIHIKQDKTIDYGLNESHCIRYFKMKSLFEESSTYRLDLNGEIISSNQPITNKLISKFPELCCILFLSYCILDVKNSFQRQGIELNKKALKTDKNSYHETTHKKGFLARLFNNNKEDTFSSTEKVSDNIDFIFNDFVITIGIPTQYDRNNFEHKRRSKQYEMLYLANQLSKSFNNLNNYVKTPIQILLNLITDNYSQIKNIVHVPETFYIQAGLYVIAETTAGIVPVRNEMQRQLNSIQNSRHKENGIDSFKNQNMGNYITMDIGAGTTDISFFFFYIKDARIRMKYYASKSIELASNVLIMNYLKTNNLDDIHLFNLENINQSDWRQSQIGFRETLFNEIRDPKNNLYSRVIQIFDNKPRKYWHIDEPTAKGCKVYGGGSRFSEFNSGQLMLNHGGSFSYNHNVQTFTEISKFINSNEINLKLSDTSGREIYKNSVEYQQIAQSLDILNIALGLSQVDFANRPDGDNGWIDLQQILPNDPETFVELGMANYDVFKRGWVDL